jgi:hypothetical protein
VNKRGTDVAAGEKAVSDAAAMEGTISEAGYWNVVDCSPTPVLRAKRAVISGGSTPPAKRWFRGSWKPRYAVRPCICPSFLLCLFCFTWIIRCAVCLPRAGHLPPGLIRCMVVPWGTAYRWCRSAGASTLGEAATAGAAAPEAHEVVADDGSPALAPSMTVVVGMASITSISSSAAASSSQPHMGAASTSAVAGDDIVEEPEVIDGHPLLRDQGTSPLMRQCGQPTGHSTKRRRCFIESVMTSTPSGGVGASAAATP